MLNAFLILSAYLSNVKKVDAQAQEHALWIWQKILLLNFVMVQFVLVTIIASLVVVSPLCMQVNILDIALLIRQLGHITFILMEKESFQLVPSAIILKIAYQISFVWMVSVVSCHNVQHQCMPMNMGAHWNARWSLHSLLMDVFPLIFTIRLTL